MSYAMDYLFHNETDKPMTVMIEPWAEEIILNAGSIMIMNIKYETVDRLETELSSNHFLISLWGGCRAEVLVDGKDQTPSSLAIPAPGWFS